MLNVLSSINEAFPRLRLRSKYPNESTTTNSPPSKDSPPSNFTRLHPRPNKLNLSIVPISTICPPIFSLFLLLQIHRKNRSSRETTSERSAGVGLDDGDREMIIGIDTPGAIFDIKSGCEDMQAESGCIIWPVAKGDQLLPVRCTFDLSLRDHFAWLTTPSR